MLKISNKKRTFVNTHTVYSENIDIVDRPAQHHFDLVKSGIIDGVSSSSGIYDDVQGEPPQIFNLNYDRLDIADALLRGNIGAKKASDVGEKGVGGTNV